MSRKGWCQPSVLEPAGEADKEAAVLVTVTASSAFLKLLNHLVGLQWWEE